MFSRQCGFRRSFTRPSSSRRVTRYDCGQVRSLERVVAFFRDRDADVYIYQVLSGN